MNRGDGFGAALGSVPGDALPVRFDDDGLVPVVTQDAASGEVLMVAFMNEAALTATRATGRVHYWSRSRGRLWRKGETSGHEQIVEAIAVNCERNSLLLTVRQIGAVCHDGYPTCFYRRIEPDGGLTVVRERLFDPNEVYALASSTAPSEALERSTRLHYAAIAFLRDTDLTDVSATSRRLRLGQERVTPRVADELRELAGVLDGSHRHGDRREDLVLEGTQVLYWVTLVALRAGVTWEALRPDRALATAVPGLDAAMAARLLLAEARRWESVTDGTEDQAARCHAALALTGQAAATAGVTAAELVDRDLGALRQKAYLADHFAAADPTERPPRSR